MTMNEPATGQILTALLDFRDAVSMQFASIDKRFAAIERPKT